MSNGSKAHNVMHWDRRKYIAGIASGGLVSLAGCGESTDTDTNGGGGETTDDTTTDGDDGEGTTTEKETLGVIIESTLENLDTHGSGATITHTVAWTMCERLFGVNMDMEVVPQLAKGIDISDDNLTWNINLKEGVEFHPPYQREFIAEDVVKNFDRAIDIAPYSDTVYGSISDYEAVDDYTVRLEFEQPSASTKAMLAWLNSSIMSPDAWEDDLDPKNHPVGTGPFKFEEWQPREFVRASKFEDYREDVPKVDEVVMRPISEPSVQITELTEGDPDILRVAPADFLDTLEDDEDIQVGQKQSTATTFALANPESGHGGSGRAPEEPTTNLKIRQAIAEAIDRPGIAEVVDGGNATPAHTWMSPASPWHLDYEPFTLGQNVEAAEELIEEAVAEEGFSTPIEIVIVSSSEDRRLRETGRVMQGNLQEVGFEPELMEVEFGTWFDHLEAYDYDIVPNYASGRIDPASNYLYFKDRFGVPYSNEEVTELLEEAETVVGNFEKRKELFHEAERIVYNEAAVIPILHPDHIHAWENSLEGYSVHTYLPEMNISNTEV
jgi:peptide/nickel transport system substrate-binding protein